MIDYRTCPGCGGPADNGHDRCLPPNPYYCTKCHEKQFNEAIAAGDGTLHGAIDHWQRQSEKLRLLWDQEFKRAEKAEAENAALREDAERYWWLKKFLRHAKWADHLENIRPAESKYITDESLDAAIDSARRGE